MFKDGRIVEQGNHKELLALDGAFAAMWAEQISASDDRISVIDDAVKPEVSGYAVEEPKPEEPKADNVDDVLPVAESSSVVETDAIPDATSLETEIVAPQEHIIHDTLAESSPVAFPTSPVEEEALPEPEPSTTDAPLPASVDLTSFVPFATAAPLAFPTSDSLPELQPESVPAPAQGPAVTFEASVNATPRNGTPDPESEPKRKRISSQNFQRLARKISITTRRQSSSIIPGLKRDSPRVSVDDGSRREGISSSDSPAGSFKGDTDKGKLKKDKKEKDKK